MDDTSSQPPSGPGAAAAQADAPPLHVPGAGGGTVIADPHHDAPATVPAVPTADASGAATVVGADAFAEADEPEPFVASDHPVRDEDADADVTDEGENEQPSAEAADAADHAPDPRPLFSELGLSEPIVRAVEEKGYLHPTPIQAQAIPYVLMGRDVLGVAQTGTGKTAGFTLPLLEILADSRARARMPRSLILEPTRELALQVAENFVDYGRHLKLNHALLIGGESMADQKEALARGVDVLIATPGRLLDLFERGGLLLNDTRILVIDEADRMLDMGFIPDVERIVALVSPMRQTLFFSATMAPEIRRLADAFLRNPKEISVARAASVANTIEAGLVLVDESDKRRALRALLRHSNVNNALIFCNRKRDVDVLSRSLLKHGFSAGALHGDLAQSVRFATLDRFKNGEIQLLVCSDVAARGIDIGGLSHVFNFDVPIHSEDYVHRIGRTGRAGRSGHAMTIAGPEDRLLVDGIERLIGAPIPRMTVDGVETAEWAATDGPRRRRGGAGRGRGTGDERRGERGDRGGAGRRERSTGRAERAPERAAAERPSRPDQTPPVGRRPGPEPRDGERAPRGLNGSGRSGGSRDGQNRGFRREDGGGRDSGRRDGSGASRWRGHEDLGPSVVGFGDVVPDFMQLPRRAASMPAGASSTQAGRAFLPDEADTIEAGRPERGGTVVEIPLVAAAPPAAAVVGAIGRDGGSEAASDEPAPRDTGEGRSDEIEPGPTPEGASDTPPPASDAFAAPADDRPVTPAREPDRPAEPAHGPEAAAGDAPEATGATAGQVDPHHDD